jgi:hypothetical protein
MNGKRAKLSVMKMMMNSVAALVTARAIRSVNGRRAKRRFTLSGILGSNLGEIQIGVRW